MYEGVQKCLHLRLFLKILTNLYCEKNVHKNNQKMVKKYFKL